MRCPADLHSCVCVCVCPSTVQPVHLMQHGANRIRIEKLFGLWGNHLVVAHFFIVHRHFDIYILCIQLCASNLNLADASVTAVAVAAAATRRNDKRRKKNAHRTQRRNEMYKIFSHRIIVYYMILHSVQFNSLTFGR